MSGKEDDAQRFLDASTEYGERMAATMDDAMKPLEQAMAHAKRLLDGIGLVGGETLSVAGTHIGSITGGMATYGIVGEPLVDYMMRVWTEGHPDEKIGDDKAREYVVAAEPILHAALKVAQCCIRSEDPEKVTLAMRAYLTVITGMVAQATEGAKATLTRRSAS